MIPSFPFQTAVLRTFVYRELTPCLVQATFCTLSRMVYNANGTKEREYVPVQSFAVSLN